MAFVQSFTDEYGTTFPSSYWNCAETNICKADQRGRVLFYAYENEASKGKRIISQKSYAVGSVSYTTYFAPTAIDPLNVNHVSQAYALANATLDTDSGQKDGNGKPIMVSFFAGATEA